MPTVEDSKSSTQDAIGTELSTLDRHENVIKLQMGSEEKIDLPLANIVWAKDAEKPTIRGATLHILDASFRPQVVHNPKRTRTSQPTDLIESGVDGRLKDDENSGLESNRLKATQTDFQNFFAQISRGCGIKTVAQPGVECSRFSASTACPYFESHVKLSTFPKYSRNACGDVSCYSQNPKSFCDEVFSLKCEFCDKSYSQRHHLMNHMRSHTGEKQFRCDVCGRLFSRQSSLTRHVHNHGVKPFVCEFCNMSFSNLSIMMNHMRGHLL